MSCWSTVILNLYHIGNQPLQGDKLRNMHQSITLNWLCFFYLILDYSLLFPAQCRTQLLFFAVPGQTCVDRLFVRSWFPIETITHVGSPDILLPAFSHTVHLAALHLRIRFPLHWKNSVMLFISPQICPQIWEPLFPKKHFPASRP